MRCVHCFKLTTYNKFFPLQHFSYDTDTTKVSVRFTFCPADTNIFLYPYSPIKKNVRPIPHLLQSVSHSVFEFSIIKFQLPLGNSMSQRAMSSPSEHSAMILPEGSAVRLPPKSFSSSNCPNIFTEQR